jgi:hypothetical protein
VKNILKQSQKALVNSLWNKEKKQEKNT